MNDKDIKLPERPEPDGFITDGPFDKPVVINVYRDSTLDAYAREAVRMNASQAENVDQVQALREALDALKAENEMLREALKDADSEMDWLDEDMDTCDHSVGVCMCSYWSVRRKMKAALAREDKHD
ncbi:hypothetical protein BU332_22705 [Salmonella enterica]|nr:hypothetical protein [Salmonella enterica]EBR1292728.1 hypothetical protein [Salmonella enterica]